MMAFPELRLMQPARQLIFIVRRTEAWMSKSKPIPEAVRLRAVAAVAAAWEAGCPVADCRPEGQTVIADVCLRRFGSLARRGIGASDRAGQIRDLARGLVEASGQDRGLVGPLMRDYEWLAEQELAAIIAEAQDAEPGAAPDPATSTVFRCSPIVRVGWLRSRPGR
jgi:hypothetical protein